MEISLFLARLLGIYFLIIAADMLIRRREFEGAVKDFVTSKGLLLFSGSTSLLFGLAIVITYPIYEKNLQGLITLIGYFLIFRGVVRFACPSYLQKKMFSFVHKRYWILFSILLILGVYLTYAGFTTCV